MDGLDGNLIREDNMIDSIKKKIKSEINIIKIEIIDQSSAHANHPGNSGGGHYQALIISNDFNDKSLVERHQMVYKALGKLMTNEIHAFSMKTMTENEFKTNG